MDVLEYRAVLVWKIFPPFLLLFGTFGNLLTIIVLTHRRNRYTSTAIYLTALAVSDFLVLWTGLLRQWIIYTFDIDIRAQSAFGCKLHLFFIYGSLLCSSWFLVAVTIERFVSVWFPHKVKSVCSLRNACAVITLIVSVIFLLNIHWLYGVYLAPVQSSSNITTKSACGLVKNSEYREFFVYYEWIYLCIFSLVPLTVLTSANISIIVRLLIRKLKTRIQVAPNNGILAARRNNVSQLTIMLLIVNTMFIICTPPISIYNIWEDQWKASAKTSQEEAALKLTWAVVNLLMYLNTTLNFFLYFLSGSKFRKQVKDFFCRGRNRFGTSITQPTDET
ncbi:neuromedin-U receptor 2-like [Mercenaria mercenaria]|uniref:neuromedin-U receptor 2-like n=1 Tax=Mercenaria mercenaria TaxID=6596 RepID=UPI001E1DB722|nr:neuromedin-U receptor 2-like [Mercenaria mercenaria]